MLYTDDIIKIEDIARRIVAEEFAKLSAKVKRIEVSQGQKPTPKTTDEKPVKDTEVKKK